MLDEIFWEIHSELPREGPGDNASTQRAFEMMKELPDSPTLLDVACGPGMQTLELARLSNGRIVALDLHLPFLKELEVRAKRAGVFERIKTVNASMVEMPFANAEFDAIWCEGAMYFMGPKAALHEWKQYLKPHGYMAFTEPCFLKENPPNEVLQFWINDYPQMCDIAKNKMVIEECGYDLVGNFTIPASSSWWDEYYTPQEARLKMLREKYRDSKEKLARIEETQLEIDLHRQYGEFYGYEFFVVQSR